MEGSRYFQTPYLYKENGFKEKAYAEKLIQELSVSQPLQCTVEKIERKKENRNPPLLFNLAELQNVCSKLFKISPDAVSYTHLDVYKRQGRRPEYFLRYFHDDPCICTWTGEMDHGKRSETY